MLDVLPRRLRLFVLICAPVVAEFMPTPSAAEPKLADLSSSDLQTVIIRLDRGACYGSCPIYTLTISGNGGVVFEGEKFVKAIGRQMGHLPEKSIRKLLAAFEDTLSGKKCSCAFWFPDRGYGVACRPSDASRGAIRRLRVSRRYFGSA